MEVKIKKLNPNAVLPKKAHPTDAGYRGEVMAKFKGTVNYDCVEEYGKEYSVGDRIGQLIIMPIPDVEFVEADELSETDRGTGGYGSSGN